MSNRIMSLSAAAALGLAAAVTVSSANAAEPGVVYGKSVGALAVETRGLPTSPAEVRQQGGFATAGAADWTTAPAAEQAGAAAVFGGGSIGALSIETRGLATSAAEVRRQGGAVTASAVQWIAAPTRQ